MKRIRRLVICLDGTWNNRDDATNVLHHYSLSYECNEKALQDANGQVYLLTQQRFYNEGVGTGPLDRITGGGFGLGLENHIRETYNWLVQNYEDGDGTAERPRDEIYIFGFSRGAYEARSLVGFIALCGLLRRGSPLTVTQLWERYCLLGLKREERPSAWGDANEPRVRPLSALIWDPWLVTAADATLAGGLPGQRADDLDADEKLLLLYSRRVQITYLGVYDTVGAEGWDALAIPGLRSKMARHNNMRPTTIVQHCRHALAMDEHRSSFERTPFVAYIGEKTSEDEAERGGAADLAPQAGGGYKMRAQKWHKIEEMWNQRIEQRWFVGAHSNVGGGYPDNVLAQYPLRWLIDGAQECGLVCEKAFAPAPAIPPQVNGRDSYAEFVAPVWEMILRAKRNYRTLDPAPELRANRDEAENKGRVRAGFSLVHIHETIDPTVPAYWANRDDPPANLVGYARRARTPSAELSALAGKQPRNPWLAGGFVPHVALIAWATLAAIGFAVSDRFFEVWKGSPPAGLLAALAALFALVDWAESAGKFALAQKRQQSWERALLDAIYWLRAFGVLLFLFGAIGVPIHLWRIGWATPSAGAAWQQAWPRMDFWWPVPLGAVAGLFIAHFLNKTFGARWKVILRASAVAVVLSLAAIPAIVHLAQALGHVILSALRQAPAVAVPTFEPPQEARLAGLLLLLQLALLYFWNATRWQGEPMRTANLGTVTDLQKPWTPAGIKACLDRWCAMLGDHHDEQASECGMADIARQALYRDLLGYIPVYSVVLGFGLWFGASELGWAQQHWAPLSWLWWVVPLVTLVTDYIEDACHLRYLSLHTRGAQPSIALTVFCKVCTLVKMLGVLLGLLGTFAALALGTWRVIGDPGVYGWRGLFALSVSTVALAMLLLIGVGAVSVRCKARRRAGNAPRTAGH